MTFIFMTKNLRELLIETNILKDNVEYIIIGLGVNFVSCPKNLKNNSISISSFFKKKANPIDFFIYLTKEVNDSLKKFKNLIFKIDKHYLKHFKDYGKIINIESKGKIIRGIFFWTWRKWRNNFKKK